MTRRLDYMCGERARFFEPKPPKVSLFRRIFG